MENDLLYLRRGYAPNFFDNFAYGGAGSRQSYKTKYGWIEMLVWW